MPVRGQRLEEPGRAWREARRGAVQGTRARLQGARGRSRGIWASDGEQVQVKQVEQVEQAGAGEGPTVR